jgi:hypothetical protein
MLRQATGGTTEMEITGAAKQSPAGAHRSTQCRLVLLSLFLLSGAVLAQGFDALIEEGQPRLGDVETQPSLGNDHVSAGTQVAQDQDFPLSGPHASKPMVSGFYTEPQPKGELLHALEHGQVVVYYDEPGFKGLSMLKRWSKDRANDWTGLIAVPHEGLGDGLVLTAWRRRLDLPAFDEAALAAFIDAYSGRGPENPVR